MLVFVEECRSEAGGPDHALHRVFTFRAVATHPSPLAALAYVHALHPQCFRATRILRFQLYFTPFFYQCAPLFRASASS